MKYCVMLYQLSYEASLKEAGQKGVQFIPVI